MLVSGKPETKRGNRIVRTGLCQCTESQEQKAETGEP